MLTPRDWAIHHSAHCFFNSYLRDLGGTFDPARRRFTFTVPAGTLELPVRTFSRVGAHVFDLPLRLTSEGTTSDVDFPTAAAMLIPGDAPDLATRLANSLRTMELSFEKRALATQPPAPSFLSSEQGLLVGHGFHPTPKSRDEFTEEDLLAYGPEFGARLPLAWLWVRPEILWEERSRTFGDEDWTRVLYPRPVPVGFAPFPVHPWQQQILRTDPVIREWIARDFLREADPIGPLWHATSSLRSLYSPEMPFMVKVSMSVKLTNSIRHLQPKEVVRGMLLQDAFHTTAGLELSGRYPRFRVLHEPVALALRDQSGTLLPQTVALLRENPFTEARGANVVLLATLTQRSLRGEATLLQELLRTHAPARWFQAFLDHAVTPLLIAQADYGILLGAHQQNLLLELEEGLPVGAYFRDCQGTGFSDLGQRLLGPEMPDREKFLANVLPREAGQELFTYYLVVNSVLCTIASVAAAAGEDEASFLEQFRRLLRALAPAVRDPSILRHLLTSPELRQKGNFRCSLRGINENTTADPLAIYNAFPNPLHQASHA